MWTRGETVSSGTVVVRQSRALVLSDSSATERYKGEGDHGSSEALTRLSHDLESKYNLALARQAEVYARQVEVYESRFERQRAELTTMRAELMADK